MTEQDAPRLTEYVGAVPDGNSHRVATAGETVPEPLQPAGPHDRLAISIDQVTL